MKKSRLRSIAQQIVEAEKIIHQDESQEEVAKAQEKIIYLTSLLSFEDIFAVEELISDLLDF